MRLDDLLREALKTKRKFVRGQKVLLVGGPAVGFMGVVRGVRGDVGQSSYRVAVDAPDFAVLWCAEAHLADLGRASRAF